MTSLSYPKALILGGSGFVGSALVRELKKKHYHVTLLNRGNKPIDGTRQLIADRTVLAQVHAVAEKTGSFDVVFDVSAYTRRTTEIAWSCFASHTQHWVHLSTAAVYKEPSSKEVPEHAPHEAYEIGGAQAWGDYGRDKSQADQYLLEKKSDKTSVTILRPPYIYGPGNDLDRETFVWSRVLQQRPVILPGDGSTRLQFIHVDDLAHAFITAYVRHTPTISKRVYNVAAQEQPTFGEFVATLAAIAGSPDPGITGNTHTTGFTAREYFPFRDYPCWVNATKIQAELDWQPKHSLVEGFTKTWKALDHKLLKERVLETLAENEIIQRLQKNA